MKTRNDQMNRGFTLLELLAISVIIMILLAIIVPFFIRAQIIAKKHNSHAIITQIENACNSYKLDFYAFPISSRIRARQELINSGMTPANADAAVVYIPNGLSGRELVALFLTGYAPAGGSGKMTDLLNADGHDGFGYILIEKGKTYGPYTGTESYLKKGPANTLQFADKFNAPIYYYLYDPAGVRFDSADNPTVGPPQPFLDLCKTYRTDFLLISPGPDSNWPDHPKGGDIISNL